MLRKGFLSLGSNIGDRVSYLKEAVSCLEEAAGIKVSRKSSLYATSPVGYLNQDDFVNAVIEIETELAPEALLKACQNVEIHLKRERLIHWGPRTIDVDILWLDNFKSSTEQLCVPHARMLDRAFVMIPLSELSPELVIEGKTVIQWCSDLADQEVRKMTHENW